MPSQAKSTAEEGEGNIATKSKKGIRDDGVSDEIWAELEKAKQVQSEGMEGVNTRAKLESEV